MSDGLRKLLIRFQYSVHIIISARFFNFSFLELLGALRGLFLNILNDK